MRVLRDAIQAVRACVDFTFDGCFLVEHEAFVATKGILNEPHLGKRVRRHI